MKQGLRKYLSLFLLGIFLFSYTEKSIHDIIHSGDEHCHSLTDKHFHTQEHHCYICDFELSLFDNSASPLQVNFTRHYTGTTASVINAPIFIENNKLFSSRAPPQSVI